MVFLAGSANSIAMVDVVFRHFRDFDPHIGTPIDIMHNLESGVLKDLLEVITVCSGGLAPVFNLCLCLYFCRGICEHVCIV